MSSFTPWSAAAGGALIGASASLLLMLTGRIAGISTILGGALRPAKGDGAWRWLFLAGLLAGGALFAWVRPATFGTLAGQPLAITALAGVLVGVGTQLGSGCTSGHGVCGISRLSTRSIVATATFMASAAVTVFVVRHVLGGPR